MNKVIKNVLMLGEPKSGQRMDSQYHVEEVNCLTAEGPTLLRDKGIELPEKVNMYRHLYIRTEIMVGTVSKYILVHSELENASLETLAVNYLMEQL